MCEPFIGEIAIFANIFIPDGWLICNGQSVSISQYPALFTVIGTVYGGDGSSTFNLPNLNGKAAIGVCSNQDVNLPLGTSAGDETVTLDSSTVPAHTHQLSRKSPQDVSAKGATPTAFSDTGVIALAETNTPLAAMADNTTANSTLAAATISSAGGNTEKSVDAHENRQPYMSLFFGIAYEGVFPAKS